MFTCVVVYGYSGLISLNGTPNRCLVVSAVSASAGIDYLADCQRLLELLGNKYNGKAEAIIAPLYYDAFQIRGWSGHRANEAADGDTG